MKKIESWLPEKKGFLGDFTKIIFENRTRKKILYRQEKLADLVHLENQNNMDYFYIEEDEKKIESSVNKFKINKVNNVISPEKPQKNVAKHPAFYNTFNFTKLTKKNTQSHSFHNQFSK